MFYFNFNLCIWEKNKESSSREKITEKGIWVEGQAGGAMGGVKWCLDDDVNGDGDEET